MTSPKIAIKCQAVGCILMGLCLAEKHFGASTKGSRRELNLWDSSLQELRRDGGGESLSDLFFQGCRREGLLEQGSALGAHALLIEVLTRIT